MTLKTIWQIPFAIAFIASVSSAQAGKLPFSTFAGGAADNINLASLNIHIDIPIHGKGGRGLPFSYALSFDNSIWSSAFVNGVKTWVPSPNFGWRGFTEAFIGYVDYAVNAATCVPSGAPTTKYNGFTYHDNAGGSHYGGNMVDSAGCFGGPHDIEHALDGSGYTTEVTLTGTQIAVKVYTPNGAVIVPPLYIDANTSQTSTPIGNGTITDSNGNQLTVSVSGSVITFTDTLGTTVMTVDNSDTTSVKYTYTGPDANPSSTVVHYSQYVIKTNFGVPGIAEYAETAASLPSSIVFPDMSSYQFTYETTPGFPSDVTGRLASITLPTGGQISYLYTGGNNGIAADGSTTGITRTIGASQFTYARGIPASGPTTTTATDPNGNQSVFAFSGSHELQRQSYQGSAQSGSLLGTQLTCYNGNTTNCASATVSASVASVDVYDILPGGLQARATTQYDSLGNTIESDEYDYATGAPGPLLRKILTAYAPLSNNITGKPASVTVYDGAGNIASQALFAYDETAVLATSEPQHVGVTGSRGNLTTLKQLVATSPTETYLIKSFAYYDTGALNSYTDVNSAVITYSYGPGSCNASYPTGVSFPLGLTVSSAWDCVGGVHTSITDENGHLTSFGYSSVTDPHIWRLKQRTDPLGNIENTVYGLHTNESVLSFNGNNSLSDVVVTFDIYGRPATAQIRQSANGATFDTIETDYDSLGRAARTTASYVGTIGQTNSTIAAAVTTYDGLDRVLRQTGTAGDFVAYIYNGTNDILAQQGPAPVSESLKQKQFEYDALGRLTSVCEITTLPGAGPCGQSTAATGYLTRYTYDTLDNILTVTQNAQSGVKQTRSFTYDLISRKTSESAPESGTVNYVYDSDASGTCPNSNPGDIVRRVDAAGVSTCYVYDARRRLTSAVRTGSGIVNVTGSEQSTQVLTHAATQATGQVAIGGIGTVNITIQGGRQSKVDTGDCNLINHVWVCRTIYDHGSVFISVNGIQEGCSYSQTVNISSSSIAACLASALANDPNSPAGATSSGSTVTITGRSPNSAPYYSFTITSSFDGADFSGPSYSGTPSSGILAVGSSGNVSITINNVTKSVPYQSGSTPGVISTSLAQAFVGDPDVTASAAGNTVNFTSSLFGSIYNYLISSNSTTQSFAPVASGLSGGTDNTFGTSYDTGTASVTAGSTTISVTYGQNDTPLSIATNLAAAINLSSAFPATASVLAPARVELVAKQSGNLPLSATSSTTNSNFGSPSFMINVASAGGLDESQQTKFIYDTATVNGQAMTNTKGRLAEAITCVSSCVGNNVLTDLGFSYDSVGNLIDAYESTPHSGGYYHLTATYWANNGLHTLGGLSGLPTFTFQPDSEGRVSAINASTGQNPVTQTSFNTASQVTEVTLGSGDSDTYTIDENTGRMTKFVASIASQTLTGTLSWNVNGSLAGLTIGDQFNPSANQSCTYGYDDLARLGNANCGSAWSQTFNYDPFGNISKSGSSAFQPIYSSTTNRIQSLPGVTPTYNANGALLSDGAHTYSWSADGTMASIDSVVLVFDAMGRMVEQAQGGSYTQIVYSPTGDKLALMNGQTLRKAFLDLPGGSKAVYNSSGLAYYRHPDWLGSGRLASTPARAIYSDLSYAPFGETYGQFGTADLSFTGKNQDTVTGLYDFLYREYSPTQGRWVTCDPLGASVANSSDPQSWNKYSYALNNPLGLTDPTGLDDVPSGLPPCKNLIIMGITNTSSLDGGNWDMRRSEQLAAEYGYNIAFPYSGLNIPQSLADMKQQGGGGTTAATTDVMDALKYTFDNGGTSVISISGGAQAYQSTMRNFNQDPDLAGAAIRIASVVYLSPGLRGGGQLVRGSQSTERYSAHGPIDGIVNFTASSPPGTIINKGKLACPKHWAVCELEEFLKMKCGNKCKHGPCSSQVFSPGKGARENPGGAPPPPEEPGYHTDTRCYYGDHGPECRDVVFFGFGWLGGNDNPGGPGAWMIHTPYW